MKKILSAIMIVMLVFALAACGDNNQTSTDPEPTPAPEPSALQLSMEKLLDEGWQATDNGYVFTDSTDYCDMEINARPGDTDLDLEIHYDYRESNDARADSYNKDKTLAASVAAMWCEKIVTITEPEFDNLNYIIYVGDTKVADATMTYEEAKTVAAENDD